MNPWSPEKDAELTRLWMDGLRTAEIGQRLGVSKNSAVGRAHRLKLPPRPSPIRPRATNAGNRHIPFRKAKAKPGPRIRSGSAPSLAVPNPRPLPASARLDYSQRPLSNKPCAWPIGHPDEPDYTTCAEKAVEGKPFCPDHCSRAYIRVRPKVAGEAA